MAPLDLVTLSPLMELTRGRSETSVGLIDGPVATGHPGLEGTSIREIPGRLRGTCAQADSAACMHGTFVAGILSAKRGSAAPAICPDCTLLVRPIFAETTSAGAQMPSASPDELASAIIDCVDAGAGVINLSAALSQPSSRGERRLEESLGYASRRHVIVVVAAGNQGAIGSSAITRHPWVIPVASCDLQGRPISSSNLARSTGRWGLSAPGSDISSLGADDRPLTFGGTSAAAPFVTGAIALLRSAFPAASAVEVKFAVTQRHRARRSTLAPPLLDAWSAYQFMLKACA